MVCASGPGARCQPGRDAHGTAGRRLTRFAAAIADLRANCFKNGPASGTVVAHARTSTSNTPVWR